MKDQLKIGIIGAGGFSEFAALSFLKVPGISIQGITDTKPEAARHLSGITGAHPFPDQDALLKADDIDLIYIATPPYLHYQQSLQALQAGKHVICEKPAALHTAEAEQLSRYAREHGLLYVVNLMQRYNPLYMFTQTLIRENWLGEFGHGFFENYASDEKLIPDHWFWDLHQSGGIFIEHGVHFFDMFSGWLGEGQLVHAFQLHRDIVDQHVYDRVQAVVLYPKGPVNFYHGFNQPKVLDRQELRLQFEHGDITLYEWVPVKIRIHGLVTNDVLQKMLSTLPGSTVQYHDPKKAKPQMVRGNFQDIRYDHHITLEYGASELKMQRYEELLINMIKDQWAWIQDPAHHRLIDDRNAVESTRMAEQATLQSSFM